MRSPSTRVSYTASGAVAGPRRTAPVRQSYRAPCQGQTRQPSLSSEPLDRSASWWRQREDTALRMDLEASLERLSETSRAVVWLHDVEGYTHEEIAAMMGKTPSFSKSQLARAHVRLRRWLGEEVAV